MNPAVKNAGASPAPASTVSLRAVLYWTAPSLFCLLIYWWGLRTWFQMDDFAWLALHMKVHDWGSFVDALFKPLAQGTIRPLSERLFFMGYWWMFGMEAAPFRITVFLTQFGNLVLLCSIARKLTGSAAAGLLAAVLWLVNANLYVPMSWSAAYNEVLCAFFMLLAFYFFLRYIETGRRKWYAAQWAAFLTGFGALELNVVYPAIAALYAFLFARSYLLSTAPMIAASGVYAIIHRAVAPQTKSEIYRMFFDAEIFGTLATYIRWVFGADRYADAEATAVWPHYVAEAVAGAALLCFALWMIRRRRYLAVFCLGWFFIVLAPVLPLKNHITDYYLFIPTIGLAILAGWGLTVAWRAGTGCRVIAICAALMYAVPSVWMAHGMTREYFVTSRRAAEFIRRVAYAHRLHPDKTLLIRGVDNSLFWAIFWDNPFQIFGLNKIYLTAESEKEIEPFPEMGTLTRFFLPDSVALASIRARETAVYELVGSKLRNITPLYEKMLEYRDRLEQPRLIRIGEPMYAAQLGAGWWEPEGNHRWMSERAALRIRGPASDASELIVTGVCPPQHMTRGPLTLSVSANGRLAGQSRIGESGRFTIRYPLPDEWTGQSSLQLELATDRTLNFPPDMRRLGVAISTVEVAP